MEYKEIIQVLFIIFNILIINIVLKFIFNLILDKFRIQSIKNAVSKNYSFRKYINNLEKNISELDIKYYLKNVNIISSLTSIITSIGIAIFVYTLSMSTFGIISTSFILSFIAFNIPYIVIKIALKKKKDKIKEIFPAYLLSLKTYTSIDNNIVSAMEKSYVQEPLKKYIDLFNISVLNGISIYDSFEMLKNNINIAKISECISLLQYNVSVGGDITNILDKYAKLQLNINLRNEQEKQNIFYSKMIMIILICINIYILVNFVILNSENFTLITSEFIGKIILNINILSFIIIGVMYYKLDEE